MSEMSLMVALCERGVPGEIMEAYRWVRSHRAVLSSSA
jgi:hypothetical protein